MTLFETMRDIYSLMSVALLGLSDSLKANIDMFALLNRCGRQCPMQRELANPRRWIDVMAQVAENLDYLFCLLWTKASFCDLVENSESETAVAGKRQLEKEAHDQSVKKSRWP
jgi:hypothetical protein